MRWQHNAFSGQLVDNPLVCPSPKNLIPIHRLRKRGRPCCLARELNVKLDETQNSLPAPYSLGFCSARLEAAPLEQKYVHDINNPRGDGFTLENGS